MRGDKGGKAQGIKGAEVKSPSPDVYQLLLKLHSPELDSSGCHSQNFDRDARIAKATAISSNDQCQATQVWCAQTIASIQRGFIAAFADMKADAFYKGWCKLERCEIDLLALRHHYVTAENDPHKIDYIERMIPRWQALYPYKIFFSPEFLKKRVECSICGTKVAPRFDCGHEKFGIYDGEMCHHRVTEVQMLGISMVQNPVQRYSVAFLSSEESGDPKDHYNYGNLKFVVERLDSPFHGWDSYLTSRVISATQLSHLASTDPCPCLSGKVFGDCCAGRLEVTIPHLQVQLDVAPSKLLPKIESLF